MLAILLAIFPFATLFVGILYFTQDEVQLWATPVILLLLAIYSILTGIALARQNLRIEELEKRHGGASAQQ